PRQAHLGSNAEAALGYNRAMSDQEIILETLGRVQRRLHMSDLLHDAAIVLGLLAVAVSLCRVLHVAGDHTPALSAVSILIALLLLLAGLLMLVQRTVTRRTSLSRAAAEADVRAVLNDELKTAYWFIAHPSVSPWTAAQIERAARSAR